MALYLLTVEDATLHISKGNAKIGKTVWSFSTLPGNKDNLLYVKGKGLLTTVPGTCSKYCEGCFNGGCYAVRDAKLHCNVTIKAWGDNTLLLRHDPKGLFDQIDTFIKDKNKKFLETNDEKFHRVRTWRWNVSGEIENLLQLELMNEIAVKHPEVMFGVYTKSFDILEDYLTKHGEDGFAKNFVINVSQWHHVADDFLKKHPNVFNIFEYDDSNLKNCLMSDEDKDRLKGVTHCPAVTKEGHHAKNAKGENITCDMCKRCYTKSGAHTAVHAH